MISKKYLEQALRIKKDFLSTDQELFELKNELESVYNSINSTLKELVKIKENSTEYTSNDEFQKDVAEKLAEFEDQSKRVEKYFTPLNDQMEGLKSEEQELFKTLVSEYPNIKEEDLVKEVQDYVRSKLS